MNRKLKPLEYALWLLKSRDRSIGEMEEKLRRKDFPPDEVTKVITFLIEKRFLDDEKFAENFVRFKKTIKPVGKYYLRNKLLLKKIPKDIVENALSALPDSQSEISDLTDRWLEKNQKIPKEKRYEKLSRHLLSRGFDWEMVREVVSEKL